MGATTLAEQNVINSLPPASRPARACPDGRGLDIRGGHEQVSAVAPSGAPPATGDKIPAFLSRPTIDLNMFVLSFPGGALLLVSSH